MIDEKIIQIREYRGEGYQPLIYFAGWRVAVLNFLDCIHPTRIADMERHLETDEAFILLRGKAVLIVGGNDGQIADLVPCEMVNEKLYNVRASVWHTILLSPDASVLIVENSDTGEDNSEKCNLDDDTRKQIVGFARQFSFAVD
jgi:ureidoglycolate hydrolase